MIAIKFEIITATAQCISQTQGALASSSDLNITFGKNLFIFQVPTYKKPLFRVQPIVFKQWPTVLSIVLYDIKIFLQTECIGKYQF